MLEPPQRPAGQGRRPVALPGYCHFRCHRQLQRAAVLGQDRLRGDQTFRQSLGITTVPSAETLRQRWDAVPETFRFAVADAGTQLIRRANAPVTALATGHIALDCDGSPMDNSGTCKEGVSYTYKGHDGYTPMAAYLGQEGRCLELELRPGSQHSQKGFIPFRRRVLYRARRLVGPDKRRLVRLDGAHDGAETVRARVRSMESGLLWNRGAPQRAQPATPRGGRDCTRLSRSHSWQGPGRAHSLCTYRWGTMISAWRKRLSRTAGSIPHAQESVIGEEAGGSFGSTSIATGFTARLEAKRPANSVRALLNARLNRGTSAGRPLSPALPASRSGLSIN